MAINNNNTERVLRFMAAGGSAEGALASIATRDDAAATTLEDVAGVRDNPPPLDAEGSVVVKAAKKAKKAKKARR